MASPKIRSLQVRQDIPLLQSSTGKWAALIARGAIGTLLIHGARTVLNWAHRRNDALSRWLRERRGSACAIVALANKLARIGWAVLRGEKDFDLERAFRPKAIKEAMA